MWSTQFVPELSEVTETRGRASEHLRRQEMPERQREDVLLLMSELVTNAVRHGSQPLAVRIDTSDRRVRVEVDDGSHLPPILLPVDPRRGGGMGVKLVDELSDRWGVITNRSGKTVWFEIALP